MAVQSAAGGANEPGILYYDSNPTTAKLATAGLRLAGYQVFNAADQSEAVRLCRAHGPGGDGSVVAILLDAAANPTASASVLKALAQLPGAAELPGILLVARNNPTPIPAASGLPVLKRPFSTPALVKIVRETIEDRRVLSDSAPVEISPLAARIKALLNDSFPKLRASDRNIAELASALASDQKLPTLAAGIALQGELGSTKLEALLEMLGSAGATGIFELQNGERRTRLHLDEGRIRLGESHGGDEDLKLGRFVVEGGFMRDEELEAFLASKDPAGRPLGERLVSGGFLSPAELAQVLMDQAREITCQLLKWKEGEFTFTPAQELHPLAASAANQKVELLVAEALLDGLRRIDESATMGPQMADVDDVYMRIDEQIGRIGRHALARDELSVLEMLNGRNSVKEIARRTRTGTLAVARILYRLSRANLARRRVTPVSV